MKHQKLAISELAIPYPSPASATSELMNPKENNTETPVYRRKKIMTCEIGPDGFVDVPCGEVIVGENDLELLNECLSKISTAGFDIKVTLNARLVDDPGDFKNESHKAWIARLYLVPKSYRPNNP